MKVTVNGKIKQLKLIERERTSSGLHKKAREIITKVYPYKLYEEIYIPGTKLRFDFFIPRKLIAVEVQGMQHSTYSSHFHGQEFYFKKSLERDKFKREFCVENGWQLIELCYNTEDQWEQILRGTYENQ